MPNREIRDPSLPPEHLGQIPAGHERDEENRRRTDSLAEKAAETGGDAGGLIPDKLKKVDNEIARRYNRRTGDYPISNKREDRRYVWVHADENTTTTFRLDGYTAVQGDPKNGGDKEAVEAMGQHKAGGTTLRGWGDCLLYWCTWENWHELERAAAEQAIAMGAAEEIWEQNANEGPVGRSFGPLAHGRQDDPKLRQTVLRGTQGEVSHLMDDFRTGKPIGNFRPGDDVRMRNR